MKPGSFKELLQAMLFFSVVAVVVAIIINPRILSPYGVIGGVFAVDWLWNGYTAVIITIWVSTNRVVSAIKGTRS